MPSCHLLQEEFIRGALAQLEAERDEVRGQLEEEHRLHMAARLQVAAAVSLEKQDNSYTPACDQQHEHDHTQGQHGDGEHSYERSGELSYSSLIIIVTIILLLINIYYFVFCMFTVA